LYFDDERRIALNSALRHFGSLGLTGVGDAGVTANEVKIYREFADQKKLTTRVYAMIGDVGDDFKVLSANGPLKGYADDRFNLRSVKLYADGALGSRGAALLEPYSDDHSNKGLLFMDDATVQEYEETLARIDNYNGEELGELETLAAQAMFLSHGDFYALTVIERLGQAPEGVVRAGCACYTTEEEIDRLLQAITNITRAS